MKKFVFLSISLFLLYGCTEAEGINCGRDKQCLKNAFSNCEQAYGI